MDGLQSRRSAKGYYSAEWLLVRLKSEDVQLSIWKYIKLLGRLRKEIYRVFYRCSINYSRKYSYFMEVGSMLRYKA